MPMTLTFLSNKIRNYFYIFLVPTLITLGIKITPNTIFLKYNHHFLNKYEANQTILVSLSRFPGFVGLLAYLRPLSPLYYIQDSFNKAKL